MTVTSTAPEALLGVYARVGPLFVAGEGSEVIADDGTRYLDFVAGIAVNALGYNHAVIRAAVLRALESGLVHVSNLYRTEPGERLAEELVARSFADRVFFCNSGAEANEAAFKFARKWSRKTEIVAFTGAFHGRLFASLAATDRPDYRKPFEPLVPGVHIVPLEDWAVADRMISANRTAAVTAAAGRSSPRWRSTSCAPSPSPGSSPRCGKRARRWARRSPGSLPSRRRSSPCAGGASCGGSSSWSRRPPT